MNGDTAWEWHLAMCEESRHHGQCDVCGRYGVYGADMYECETCGLPVHESCAGEHWRTEHEENDE